MDQLVYKLEVYPAPGSLTPEELDFIPPKGKARRAGNYDIKRCLFRPAKLLFFLARGGISHGEGTWRRGIRQKCFLWLDIKGAFYNFRPV